MGTHIHRGKANEHGERQEREKQLATARAPSQQHTNHRNTHMRAGEGGRGPFARIVGHGEKVIEYAIFIARRLHHVEMSAEIIA